MACEKMEPVPKGAVLAVDGRDLGEKHFISIRNHVTFLDIQTAEFYIDKMLPLLEDDAFGISEETKVNAYYVAFQATFLGSPHLRFY